MSDEQLDINVESQAQTTIVRVAGEIDLRTSPKLRHEFLVLLERDPGKIIVDLSSVSYVDSSGVGTIVELKRRAMKYTSDVILVGLQPRVQSLFEITRLNDFFTIANSIEEAQEK